MKKKFNDNSDKFSDWSVKKLKDEALGYYQNIYQIGCYGTKDLMNYDNIIAELERRGYESGTDLVFHKQS